MIAAIGAENKHSTYYGTKKSLHAFIDRKKTYLWYCADQRDYPYR